MVRERQLCSVDVLRVRHLCATDIPARYWRNDELRCCESFVTYGLSTNVDPLCSQPITGGVVLLSLYAPTRFPSSYVTDCPHAYTGSGMPSVAVGTTRARSRTGQTSTTLRKRGMSLSPPQTARRQKSRRSCDRACTAPALNSRSYPLFPSLRLTIPKSNGHDSPHRESTNLSWMTTPCNTRTRPSDLDREVAEKYLSTARS